MSVNVFVTSVRDEQSQRFMPAEAILTKLGELKNSGAPSFCAKTCLGSSYRLGDMESSKGLRFLISCILIGAALAVRINEDGHKIIYLPKGESVKLGCPFSSDPEDNTPDNDWDIQWKQVKPGPYPQYNPLLGYHDHRIIYPGPPDLQKRVGFISSNPSLYDASMQLRDLQVSDSATYECTVKKTTEATRKVTITVQGKTQRQS
ncbi:LOW QUALITY PROTEIN: V-set and immunoglobulin domain-containing protein 8 [Vipera latastei]